MSPREHLAPGCHQLLDAGQIARAVLDVLDVVDLQQAREQGGRDIAIGVLRNVVDDDRRLHGPGDLLVVPHHAVHGRALEIGRQHHQSVGAGSCAALASRRVECADGARPGREAALPRTCLPPLVDAPALRPSDSEFDGTGAGQNDLARASSSCRHARPMRLVDTVGRFVEGRQIGTHDPLRSDLARNIPGVKMFGSVGVRAAPRRGSSKGR